MKCWYAPCDTGLGLEDSTLQRIGATPLCAQTPVLKPRQGRVILDDNACDDGPESRVVRFTRQNH